MHLPDIAKHHGHTGDAPGQQAESPSTAADTALGPRCKPRAHQDHLDACLRRHVLRMAF
ncbi:hypothetical protein DPMN_174042 [Dreissena polymorpha]|uniref:Uncharacterized protein n=1 Tax=Dreissena polymorpha TaxID=45954 RepID=A0A9D4IGQ7_DREPO|nr:hypothetical protein DPMN_174042 [Dreissena polymorpha]